MNAPELIKRVREIELFGMNTANKEPQLLNIINEAIRDIWPKLIFATDQLQITMENDKANYDLPQSLVAIIDQYRYFQNPPTQIDYYTGTRFRTPLEDDKTYYVPLNDYNHPYSFFTPSPFLLTIRKPTNGDKVILSTIQSPRDITEENMEDGRFQIYPQLAVPIAARVAYLAYKRKNGHDQASKVYWMEYKQALEEVNRWGMMPQITSSNDGLYQKGFV